MKLNAVAVADAATHPHTERREHPVQLMDVHTDQLAIFWPAVRIVCPHQLAQAFSGDPRISTDEIENPLLDPRQRWQRTPAAGATSNACVLVHSTAPVVEGTVCGTRDSLEICVDEAAVRSTIRQ